MKALKFFLSFLLLIVFVSCDKKCYRELSVEEKSRLAYKGGENIVFHSSSNQFDTLKIDSNIKESILAKDAKCKNEKHIFSIAGEFRNYLYHDSMRIGLGTNIVTPSYKSKEFIYPAISTNLGYFPLSKSTPLTSININGKQLYNVYEINNNLHISSFDVDKIYFSFEYGLLKIVLHDGGYWERINY